MKVIFLDVDGVLNCSTTESNSPNGFIGVDDILLNNLKTVLDKTDAKIVLSSSWKTLNENDSDYLYLIEKLESIGADIVGKTVDATGTFNRGAGIETYLLDFEDDISEFVVLDDELFDFLSKDILKGHIVIPKDYVGLTEENMNKAIEILNGNLIYEDFSDRSMYLAGYHHG